MIPRPTLDCCLGFVLLLSNGFLHAQNPIPKANLPPLTAAEKAAAAAIQQPSQVQAPKKTQSATSRPVPNLPDVTSPAQAPLSSPAIKSMPVGTSLPSKATSESKPVRGMTKEQALDVATQPRMQGREAPRIPLPSDKLPITTSTSASGQFRVHHPDFELRSSMSSHLDQIAKDLRDVMNDAEPHTIPIQVRLTRGQEAAKAIHAGASPIAVGITEVEGGGFHLQLDIYEDRSLTLTLIRQETVRLLLAERILRGHTKITQPQNRLLLPDWVFTGVVQAMAFRAAARPPTMFAAIFKSGRIYGIEEIIAVTPTQMDSLSRSIYETSCGALVMTLVDQPDGGRRFNKFLNSLNSLATSERDLLDQAYPGFTASASSLNKWWALQLATLAKRSLSDPLTADESLAALEKAITISYHAKPEDVPKNLKKRPFPQPSPLLSTPAAATIKSHPDDLALAASTMKTQDQSVASKIGEQIDSTSGTLGQELRNNKEDNDSSASQKSSGLWLRYLTFGLMGSKKDMEMPDASKDESSNGFFSRLLRERNNTVAASQRNADEVATQMKKQEIIDRDKTQQQGEKEAAARQKATQSQAKTPSETETKVGIEKQSKAEKGPVKIAKDELKEKSEKIAPTKPSSLNPFNWFRGNNKTSEESEKIEKKTDKSQSKQNTNLKNTEQSASLDWTPLPIAIIDFHIQLMLDTREYFFPTKRTHALLDFLKRKKPEEEKKTLKPEAPRSEMRTDSVKKKKAAAPPSAPRTTNPNARPAVRPIEPMDGSQRTTNPNAKPLILPKIPANTATPSSGETLSTLPRGMVLVEIHVEDHKHLQKLPDRAKILEHNILSLRALENRVSVPMRPVVIGYLDVMLALQAGKAGAEIDKRLALLREAAFTAAQKTKTVRDYVDFYEANETEKLSGKFEDFINLPTIIQKELQPREDPIARYLDAIDKEFSK